MGCNECDDRGHFLLTECPQRVYPARELTELIRCAEWMKKGMPPVAGGVLDQSHWFMAWFEVWSREVSRYKPLGTEE